MEAEQVKSDEEESATLTGGGKDGSGESNYVMQLEKLLACLKDGVAK